MIGTWPHFWNLAGRAGLELAILQNRKVHAANIQAREVNANAAIDRLGIGWIGQTRCLLTLHLIHILHRKLVTAISITRNGGPLAAFAPHVPVAHIVVVRNADGRPVPDNVAVLHAKLNPTGRVLCVTVMLITPEEQQVRIVVSNILNNLLARPRCAAGVT